MGYRGSVGNELAGFDLLVSLSFAEGLPINLIEAGWAGTPVLATWVDGNRDLLPSSQYGVLVSAQASRERTQEALFEILASPSRRKTMGQYFQKRVMENFSGQIWLKQLLKTYEELVD